MTTEPIQGQQMNVALTLRYSLLSSEIKLNIGYKPR